MARHLTLDRIHYESFSPICLVKDKKWGLEHTCEGTLYCHDEQGRFSIHFRIRPGACWNGASVPRPFRWFLPNWDPDSPTYNLVSLLHDMLYASSGKGILTRDQADDILRGGWRVEGRNRFRASTGEFLVGLFACCHWGRDEYKSAPFFDCYITREAA